MSTKKRPLNSAKETRPWGVTARGEINTLCKLHGRGMRVCKQTKRKETAGFNVTVGDRCINMLCWVSKGISLFFSFFALFSFKDISRSRYWDLLECLRNPFYIIDWKKRKQRLLFGTSRVFFFHLPLFFFYYHTDKKRHTQQNRNTTTKHSENSTCPTIFMFLP